MLLSIVVVSIVLVTVAEGDGRAKAIGHQYVTGPGFSVNSRSARHCLALCNKHPACDAANFHAGKGKCRIITRCSPILTKHDSPYHFYFAKRPGIKAEGFQYHADSDSCLKLVEEMVDFARADRLCREQGGRLATLHEPSINQQATDMLRNSDAQFAWIGLTDKKIEGDPVHEDGRKVSETGFFPIAEQGHRNDSTRNCWSLSDSGEWMEQNCKNRKQYSLCQIVPYRRRR